jgi:hypothetical protein
MTKETVRILTEFKNKYLKELSDRFSSVMKSISLVFQPESNSLN